MCCYQGMVWRPLEARPCPLRFHLLLEAWTSHRIGAWRRQPVRQGPSLATSSQHHADLHHHQVDRPGRFRGGGPSSFASALRVQAWLGWGFWGTSFRGSHPFPPCLPPPSPDKTTDYPGNLPFGQDTCAAPTTTSPSLRFLQSSIPYCDMHCYSTHGTACGAASCSGDHGLLPHLAVHYLIKPVRRR